MKTNDLFNQNQKIKISAQLKKDIETAKKCSQLSLGFFDPLWKTGYEMGAIGKGIAIDELKELPVLNQISYLFDFGGQVFDHTSEGSWIELAHPQKRKESIAQVYLYHESLSTSGNSENPGHIVNPKTKKAVKGLHSASVIHPNASLADCLSTAMFVMGPQKSLQFAKKNNLNTIWVSHKPLKISASCSLKNKLKSKLMIHYDC